jgi:hypothetical protein
MSGANFMRVGEGRREKLIQILSLVIKGALVQIAFDYPDCKGLLCSLFLIICLLHVLFSWIEWVERKALVGKLMQ